MTILRPPGTRQVETIGGILKDLFSRARRLPTETLREFLGETIWHWDLETMVFPQRVLVQFLRLLYLVGRGFISSRAQQQAMALTYTTMLALVPAFAIVVVMFSIRGLQDARGRLEGFLIDALAATPQQAEILNGFLKDMVANVQGSGGVAGVAFFVFLFFTIIALLSTLERSLNDIWQVTRQRSFLKKFVTYWCIATLGPIFLGIALVKGSSLMSQVNTITRWSSEAGVLDQAVQQGPPGGALVSFLLTIVTFFLLYWLMPNTRVRWRPALMGAIFATLLWLGTKWALAASSASLVSYNTLYGTMATVPITMFWLYLTWLIVVLGAELSFGFQNVKTQRKEELGDQSTQVFSELVALRLCGIIATRFEESLSPPSLQRLGELTGAPLSLCSSLLFHLCQDQLLRELDLEEGVPGYVPARPPDQITVSDIIDALRERRGISFELLEGADLTEARQLLDQANAASKALVGQVTLQHMVRCIARREEVKAGIDPQGAALKAATERTIQRARTGELRRAGLEDLEALSAPQSEAPAG